MATTDFQKKYLKYKGAYNSLVEQYDELREQAKKIHKDYDNLQKATQQMNKDYDELCTKTKEVLKENETLELLNSKYKKEITSHKAMLNLFWKLITHQINY